MTIDSIDLKHSHVLSALVKRFTDAADENNPEITLWGTGEARREFMHVDDLALATVFMINNYNGNEFINIGSGIDLSIKELAFTIADKTSFRGNILWDTSKPNGMLKKCMDVSKMNSLGFKPSVSLDKGIDQMINIYKNLKNNL